MAREIGDRSAECVQTMCGGDCYKCGGGEEDRSGGLDIPVVEYDVYEKEKKRISGNDLFVINMKCIL